MNLCNIYKKGVIKMENKENKIIKSTPAQLRANKKYDRNHYKTITYKSKISDYEQIKAYAESKSISVSKLCKLCVAYCLQNGIEFDDISEE